MTKKEVQVVINQLDNYMRQCYEQSRKELSKGNMEQQQFNLGQSDAYQHACRILMKKIGTWKEPPVPSRPAVNEYFHDFGDELPVGSDLES